MVLMCLCNCMCVSLCQTGSDCEHSSLVGGSADEDEEVDKLGEEEHKEAPVKELRRCVER